MSGEDAVSPVFRLATTVDPADIDELDHVSNLVYLRWVLEVAHAHSSAVGYDSTAYRALGAVFVVRRHEVDYLRPALAGDGVILETFIESWAAASSWRCTRILRAGDRTELAAARTQWVWVAWATGRPQRIPPELKQRFAAPASVARR